MPGSQNIRPNSGSIHSGNGNCAAACAGKFGSQKSNCPIACANIQDLPLFRHALKLPPPEFGYFAVIISLEVFRKGSNRS